MSFVCSTFNVTPAIAPVIELVALVASTPSTSTRASSAPLSCVIPPPEGGYASAASPPSPPLCVMVMAFARPVSRAVMVRRASVAPLITVAITLLPAADALIALAMPASVLLLLSIAIWYV